MGEIFDRPAPSQELEWTGERLTSAVSGQIEIEHLHRYFFARAFCRDADVLDVASGEGYGSNLLAQVARSVVGVEVDLAAATHAARAYGRPNLSYVNGDARALPLPDASIDVVVSFETLEHFFEHEQFLAEVKRVLRPGGRFIISSPDRAVYSPLGSSANPFHVNELTRHEFERLLSRHFRPTFMFLQRPVLGSVLFPEGQARGVLSFERRGENHYEASSGIPRAPYNLVVASDGHLDEAQASVFFETSAIGDILSQGSERAREQVAFAQVREEYEAQVRATRAELRAAEHGTRSALSRAERAEEALARLSATRSLEVEAMVAGLREDLRAVTVAAEQHVARTADLARDLSTVTGEHRAVLRDLETARAELARAQALLDKAGADQGERATMQRKLDQRTAQLEQSQADLLVATERLLALEGEIQRCQADLASSPEAAALSAPVVDPEVGASAPPAGKRPQDVADRGEVALLQDTVKALQAQIATLQSQKDAVGLSLRIQVSLMQKLRGAGLQDDHRAAARLGREEQVSQVNAEYWRELFEHTRGSVETIMRFAGMRLFLPKATRIWVRRKIYGPRWIR
ncbi:methyltransferase domain-containing protein [Ancylobacter polymorphus]|uniref:SAM-dependent methyltransferase n=1 Tax=Ancylobacter polymorphus TaxID=223390 RepID=A0ABU0BAS7_9HYPH|nr:methyltransferase domain-containing protein [Ancylobacter polymorphus]MDQ0301614.1 SAM-dependent methyltransferase [Ancylobacter polymorphus]